MADDQVVYEPAEYLEVLGTERHEQLKAWLRANCIDPADVTVREAIVVEPLTLGGDRAIRHTVLLRNAEGSKYVDEATGEAAQEERIVPLVVDPPPQWRKKENDR